MTLAEVLARLRAHPAVEGLVTVGSTGQDSLTPASDYDVLIVLADMPAPLRVGITYVNHRLTDLLFATTQHVAHILTATEAIDGEVWAGRVARWLLAGHVEFDRHGNLQTAQSKVRSGNWIRMLGDADARAAWIEINYNLLHTRRLMRSNDSLYRQAAELRMAMYGAANLMLGYFRIRKLLWEGDKAAIRYLSTHDPPCFELLQQFLRASDLDRKFTLYEQLAAAVVAPIGELWEGEPVVLWDDSTPTSGATLEGRFAFWEALISGKTI